VTIVSGLANAARHGVLIKGGAFLENAHRISAMAFDKTGTITRGKLDVQNVIPFDSTDRTNLISLAAAVESHSEHPIARAILRHADSLGIHYDKPRNFQSYPGQGARADVNGQTVYVGKWSLLGGVNPGTNYAAELKELQSNDSHISILVGTSSKLLGAITISDEIRHGASDTINAIRHEGVRHVALITGDNASVGNDVGKSIGADDILSELLPHEKVKAIQKLHSKYGSVAMVGDGVNDAPALASADIAIAMGAAGSDSAIETADIALMSDELGKIPWLIRLSRKARRIIIQNITLSILIKFIFVILAIIGMATLWMAVFADMGISLLVIFNGMRALKSN
jgi:Cd2+/Zn2+-exporting ATPase